jgi:predicted dehydrogenase
MSQQASQRDSITRRDIMKSAAVASAAALAGAVATPAVHAAGSERVRVGLVGSGRRGIGAAQDCANSTTNIEITAIGDLFPDKMSEAVSTLQEKLGDRWKVNRDRMFIGFDAYQKVIASDVDVVLLCTPPGFRPEHLRAAVEAGKHVFMEKPVAVDPVGARSVIASSDIAAKKSLSLVAGTQRRHQNNYMEAMKRLKDGAIGKIRAAQGYWLGDYSYYMPVIKKPEWSDVEWHIRNWNYFAWLSGDIIVEQHVHNLDVLRWAIGANPIKCIGNGSRQVRTGPEFGHIYDNFSISYEFPGYVTALSMCRQMKGTSHRVSERILGADGSLYTDGGGNATIDGKNAWKYDGPAINPYVQEHTHLIEAIRGGKPINEGRQVAESTLMAIMGRISAYTGREISWDWVMSGSNLDLSPKKLEFGPLPVAEVAVPGETKLI